jgi:hypothetical protein
MTPLSGWQNFYVIVGSSAGALIGLQFVVMALLADLPRSPVHAQAGQAFATPSVVHFGAVLLLSAALCAPWRSIYEVSDFLEIVGVCGVAYAVIVTRRMRRQKLYQPVLEDWMFHAVLPFTAYMVLAAFAYAASEYAYWPLFGVASAELLLLFIGIHNAWDAATYHIYEVKAMREDTQSKPE